MHRLRAGMPGIQWAGPGRTGPTVIQRGISAREPERRGFVRCSHAAQCLRDVLRNRDALVQPQQLESSLDGWRHPSNDKHLAVGLKLPQLAEQPAVSGGLDVVSATQVNDEVFRLDER